MEKMPIANDIRRIGGLSSGSKAGGEGVDPEKLKKACTEFEAIFIQEILKFMRQTIPISSLSGSATGKEIYQSLLDQELGKNLAQKGGFRIGEMVYKQMLRKEGKKPPSSALITPFSPRTSGSEAK